MIKRKIYGECDLFILLVFLCGDKLIVDTTYVDPFVPTFHKMRAPLSHTLPQEQEPIIVYQRSYPIYNGS